MIIIIHLVQLAMLVFAGLIIYLKVQAVKKKGFSAFIEEAMNPKKSFKDSFQQNSHRSNQHNAADMNMTSNDLF